MRFAFLTIFMILFSNARGQSGSSLIGIWKIVSISKDGIYYNFKTDSIALSKEAQAVYPDKSEQQKFCMGLKMMFPDTRFHFESKGIFKQTMDTILIVEGTYKEMPSQKIIELTSRNSLNQDVTDKANYVIKDGLLYLSMAWDEDRFDFVLERE